MKAMFVACLLATAAQAAPKLRLSTAALGPFSIAQGSNGSQQMLDAYNDGDGALSISVSTSASWLSVSTSETRACGQPGGVCTAIRIGLQTSALPRGIVTGFVTVSDPNALDAPQTISVTAQIGGGVPDRLQFLVPPNNSPVRRAFTTSTPFNATASVGGGPRLTVLGAGGGSFRAVYSYEVVAQAAENVGEGDYEGSLQISGSPLAADNRSVPVGIKVTRKGIAAPTSESLSFRLAQGAAAQTKAIFMNNVGLGTLNVTGATASVTGDGSWLEAAVDGALVNVKATVGSLAVGSYTGKVTIASDAANDSIEVPVTLQVVEAGPPSISFNGAVTTLGFETGTLAVGDLVSAIGEMFTLADPVKVNDGENWPQSLSGAALFLNDQPIPISFASYGQLDAQIPFEAAEGEGQLRVERDGLRGNSVSVSIVRMRPRILWATDTSGNVIATAGGGPSAPIAAGSGIRLIAAGFGPVAGGAVAGVPAPEGASVDPYPTMRFGGTLFNPAPEVTPSFAGLLPGFVGLYQIQVTIPQNTTRGTNVPVVVQGAGPFFLNIQ
jgi:uncharacterized protein (TIGR03437 family)